MCIVSKQPKTVASEREGESTLILIRGPRHTGPHTECGRGERGERGGSERGAHSMTWGGFHETDEEAAAAPSGYSDSAPSARAADLNCSAPSAKSLAS